MYKQHSVAVVVPAYNEERFIESVIRGLPEFIDTIIVVDDCSRDSTAQVLANIRDEPRLIALRTEVNSGVGGAMALGYQRALEVHSDIIVKMDGDGQMSPEDLPRLLDAIVDSGADYAKGNRFLAQSALKAMPTHRLVANIIMTFLTKLASGYWHIFDPQNGFTAIRREKLQLLDFRKLRRGYFFENEMLSQLYLTRAMVRDVEMPSRYAEEESHVRIFNIAVTFPVLFFRKFARRVYERYILRDFSPVALFLISGFLLFLWGALFGAYIWIRSFVTGELTKTGTVMLAVLPLILGFQLLLQGLVLDINETPR